MLLIASLIFLYPRKILYIELYLYSIIFIIKYRKMSTCTPLEYIDPWVYVYSTTTVMSLLG
jgi:hypothetical protein